MIGLSRMISIAARAGIDIYTIIDQLNSTGNCPSYAVRRITRGDTSRGSCCPLAVGNALLDMYNEVQQELTGKAAPQVPTKEVKKAVTKKYGRKTFSALSAGNPLFLKEDAIPARTADGVSATKAVP